MTTAPVDRRRRGTVLLLAAILLATVVVALVSRDRPHPTDDLHPENPDPNGGQAVAQVLGDLGVEVVVADSQDALVDSRVDAATTVLVTSMEELGETTARVLGDVAADAGAVVLTTPSSGQLEPLDVPATLVSSGSVEAASGCEDPLLADLEVDVVTGQGYRAVDQSATLGCFEHPEDGGSLVLSVDDGTRHLLGSAELLANRQVTRADHAAVALRLLSRHDRLVWYHATVDDLDVGEAVSASDLLPDWLLPGLLLVGCATLALVLWRGRRLGPLVVEPLPVTVRSVEVVESRGRLYRKVRDQEHAAEALRRAARARLAARLGVHRGTPPGVLVALLAERSGRPAAELADLLLHRAVADDAALVALAGELTDLESRVVGPQPAGGPTDTLPDPDPERE